MPYRDENGHYISEEEARRRGLIPVKVDEEGEPEDEPEEEEDTEDTTDTTPVPRWTDQAQRQTGTIFVDVGRGEPVEVQVGAPFRSTVEALSDQAHYGGYYRVFLNGSEVINPEDAPATIEPGMRIAITAYDKVG